MIFSGIEERHLLNPSRIEIDKTMMREIIARDPGIIGPMIDLPGPGFVRRYSQWGILSSVYIAVERDWTVWRKIREQITKLKGRMPRGEFPVLGFKNDFWEHIKSVDTVYTFVLYCATATLSKMVHDEDLLDNLRMIVGRMNKPSYFMITFSRRDDKDFREWCIEMIRKIMGGKEILHLNYGAPRLGQTSMTSLLFRIGN